MEVVSLSRFGAPEVLTFHDVPRPAPKPREVLVQVEWIGVNFRDTWIRAGTVPPPQESSIPLILGNEVGGRIVEIGEGVPHALIDTKVITPTGGTGGYAQYALAQANSVITVPPEVDIADATAVLVQGRVALGAFQAAEVKPTDRILILGASGGIGVLLAQLADRHKAEMIIGANRTQAKATLSETYGATAAVGYQEHFSEQLENIAPEGVDVVFDGIGGTVAHSAFEHLALGTGRQIVYGFSSGTPLSVAASELIPRGVSVRGFGGQAMLPGVQDALVKQALTLLADGALRPLIGQRFPLSDAHDAHARIEARQAIGKTLLYPT